MKMKFKLLGMIVLITAIIFSFAACGDSGGGDDPTITPETVVLPTVTSVTPSGGNAPIDGFVVITFSQAMDTTPGTGMVSLNHIGGSIPLTGGSWNTPINTEFSIQYNGTASTNYTVNISGFKNAAGNTMLPNSSASFTTTAAPDTTKPTVLSVTPSGPEAAASGNLVITFSEAVKATPGTVTLNSGGSPIPLSGGSWSDGNKVLTIPYSGLLSFTYYTVNISGFEDLVGNTMVTDSTHTFTTRDTTPPTVLSVTPNGTGAAVSGIMEITFNKPMNTAIPGTVTLSGGGMPIPLSGSRSWNTPTNTAVFIPYSVSYSTTYTVNISGFQDSVGNTMDANSSYSFTTVADPIPPVPGNSRIITITNIEPDSLTLNWTKATDNVTAQANLKYYVYQNTSSFAGGNGQHIGGTLLNTGGTANIATYNVTGLTASTTYYFIVEVVDEAGNIAAYAEKRETTAPPPYFYIITGTDPSFTATRGGANVFGAVGQLIQTVIDAIRTDAAGNACSIQFGSGGSNVLDIGDGSVSFNNTGGTWGLITLTGKITSSISGTTVSPGAIVIGDTVSVTSTADITNTASTNSSRTITHNSTGTLTISGGTVQISTGLAIYNVSGKIIVEGGTVTSARNSTSGGTINIASSGTSTDVRLEIKGGTVRNTSTTYCCTISNASTGGVIISGGTVSAATTSFNSGNNVINNTSTGKITVSGSAIITSAIPDATGNVAATILLASSGSATADRLEITGGTIENTSGTTGNAILNKSNGGITMSNGTVTANGSSAKAIYKNAAGTLNVSGGTVNGTGASGYAIYNSAQGGATVGVGATINGAQYLNP